MYKKYSLLDLPEDERGYAVKLLAQCNAEPLQPFEEPQTMHDVVKHLLDIEAPEQWTTGDID